jgi:ACT domain-containing protein
MEKAVITVIGKDTRGIIARVSTLLFENKINILDITQTTMQDMFTMVMLCDITEMDVEFDVFSERLDKLGQKLALSVRIQHEEIFNSMHRI